MIDVLGHNFAVRLYWARDNMGEKEREREREREY